MNSTLPGGRKYVDIPQFNVLSQTLHAGLQKTTKKPHQNGQQPAKYFEYVKNITSANLLCYTCCKQCHSSLDPLLHYSRILRNLNKRACESTIAAGQVPCSSDKIQRITLQQVIYKTYIHLLHTFMKNWEINNKAKHKK